MRAHGTDLHLRANTMRIEDGKIVEISEALGGWLSYSAVLTEFQGRLNATRPDAGELIQHKTPGDYWRCCQSADLTGSGCRWTGKPT